MTPPPELDKTYDVECPHCHKPFAAEPMSGRAPRYAGFKCPHCRLFVPYERVLEQDMLQPADGADVREG